MSRLWRLNGGQKENGGETEKRLQRAMELMIFRPGKGHTTGDNNTPDLQRGRAEKSQERLRMSPRNHGGNAIIVGGWTATEIMGRSGEGLGAKLSHHVRQPERGH